MIFLIPFLMLIQFNSSVNSMIGNMFQTININTSASNLTGLLRSFNNVNVAVGGYKIQDPFWSIIALIPFVILIIALNRFGFFVALLDASFVFFIITLLLFSINFVSFYLLILSIAILMTAFILNYFSEKIII